MVDFMVQLLVELKVPHDYLNDWQQKGYTYALQMVDEDKMIAATHPGNAYLMAAHTKNEKGGIMKMVVLDQIVPEKHSIMSIDCSSDGGKTKNSELLAQFSDDQEGPLLKKPTQAWVGKGNKFQPHSLKDVVCKNDFGYMVPHPPDGHHHPSDADLHHSSDDHHHPSDSELHPSDTESDPHHHTAE